MKAGKIVRAVAVVIAAVAPLSFSACGGGGESPGEGGAAGHGGGGGAITNEAPDYQKAFPQDSVPRIDITIAAEDWQTMIADMTDMLGTFGAGNLGNPSGDGGPMGMPGGGFPALDGGFPVPDGGGIVSGGGSTDLIPRTPIYVPCDVATGDRVLHHVGIRFKGNSSLAMPWMQGIWKLPLRLTFDALEDTYPETKNQRLYGFKALSLSNGQSDPSLLRDKIGTEVFGSAGLPVPATAFYRVYVDHGGGAAYFGLYTGIELPSDRSFLDAQFVDHDGNLYKPDGTGATFATWDQATVGKENHEAEADFTDARGLFDALHADRGDQAAWRTGLEAHLDVDGFLHWLALNTVIQDWDTYGQMSHNYYLYATDALPGRFAWIPWDHSYAFTADRALSLSLAEVGEEWPLIRYLLDDPVYLETYRYFVYLASDFEYEADSAVARFRAAHDLIRPYVVGAEGENAEHTFTSEAAFEAGLATLIAHAKKRPDDVAAFLAQ